jgi:hypothetical protein
MVKTFADILSQDEINYILQLPDVLSNKSNLDNISNGAIKFNLTLPSEILNKLQETLGISFMEKTVIPMRWIKGDTAPHIDTGDKFLNTYLVYLNSSQGKLVLDDMHYPITQNTGYIFNEGVRHETINTGSEPRLMIGPMSENVVAIGAASFIYYYSNQVNADNTINAIAQNTANYVVGYFTQGNIGFTETWAIASSSTGTSTGDVTNGTLLAGPGIYYLYPALPLTGRSTVPYQSQICPAAPYNATNFTPANSVEFATLQNYARTQPQYPWNTGSNAQQIYRSQQNITYFNNINQQTQAIRTANGIVGNQPYPQFKTQAERLMYIQGMTLTAARNKMTGQNPSGPAGVPCSTIYQIINS